MPVVRREYNVEDEMWLQRARELMKDAQELHNEGSVLGSLVDEMWPGAAVRKIDMQLPLFDENTPFKVRLWLTWEGKKVSLVGIGDTREEALIDAIGGGAA